MFSPFRHVQKRAAQRSSVSTFFNRATSAEGAPVASAAQKRFFSYEHSSNPEEYDHMPIAERLAAFDRTRSGHFVPKVLRDCDKVGVMEDYEHYSIERKKFVKGIRSPNGLYNMIYDVLLNDLRNNMSMEEFKALQMEQNLAKDGDLLSEPERMALQDTLMCNMLFPKCVSKYTDKVTKATMLFPNAIYSHMNAGLGNYAIQKRAEMTGKAVEDIDIKEAYRFVTYYRTGVQTEELYRLGWKRDEIIKMVAKEHFLQYHHGDPFGPKADPMIFNPFKRTFYPCDSQITEGSTDLGRDHELETARLFAHAYEQQHINGPEAPLTILCAGDTGMFTDGALNSIQHLVEANERGFKMPLIYLVCMNNSAISTRIDKGRTYGMDDQDVCLMKLENRFAQYGSLIDPGFVNRTNDMREGIIEMRKAVDQVLETGRPTYVISSFPFRPGGHASDANAAPEPMILDQFKKTRDIFMAQLVASAPHHDSYGPADLANDIESYYNQVNDEVELAIRGMNLLTKKEALEISQPGITTVLAQEPGEIMDIETDYLMMNKNEFAGMGSDIYGKKLNEIFSRMDAEGRESRYVHQENHYVGVSDTKGGVYAELNAVKAEHTQKFVNVMPQEAQVMQLGAALRSVLPENNLVIVKGPHTIFNEHARDIMKYAAFLNCDRGFHGNCIYIYDGGSIANYEDYTFDDPETGEKVNRKMWLARVGEHHNTPEASSYASDANTVMCIPVDQNFLQRSWDEMIRLYEMGRFLCCSAPTSSFNTLHQKLVLSKDVIGVNDIMRGNLDIVGKNPSARKLVVLSYGPDVRIFIAKTLHKHGAEIAANCSEFQHFILNYNRCPNALVNFMNKYKNEDVDILLIDGNCDAALFRPVVTDMLNKCDFPRSWHTRECTVPKTYIPNGFGENLIQASDVERTLSQMGFISGEYGEAYCEAPEPSAKAEVQRTASTAYIPPSAGGAAAAAPAGGAGGVTIVNAPMDGDGVYITFHMKVGDSVAPGDVVAEVESDKATIEVKAPVAGTIAELFVKEQEEMDVTPETQFFSISGGGGAAPAAAAPAGGAGGEVVTVNAPMDGDGVYITFHMKVGDSVSPGDVVAEVESDKATIEVKAPSAGTIAELLVKEQEEMDVTPETAFFTIQTGGGGAAPAAAPAAGGSGKITTVNAPMDGDGVYITFHMQVGASVSPGDVVAEVESDKATIEVKAPVAGTIKEHLVKEQEEMDVTPETAFFTIEEGGGAAPAAPAAAPAAPAAAAEPEEAADGSKAVPLSKFQLGMVKAMTIKPTDTRVFNHFDCVDFDKVRAVGKENGVTPPAVMIKHLGEALKELDLNKKLSADRKTMLHKGTVNIGVAVDVGNGLRTCVLRDVTNKDYTEIDGDIRGFVEKGKAGKLGPQDMDLTDVCWTLTSLGKNAARFAVSVIPPGTVGIMSLGKMAPEGGQNTFISMAMCHATLTGGEGVSILHKVRNSFE